MITALEASKRLQYLEELVYALNVAADKLDGDFDYQREAGTLWHHIDDVREERDALKDKLDLVYID